MIINELAYKVTIKADEFLNGKRKVKDEVSKLNKDLSRAEKERLKELEKQRQETERFGKTAVSAFRNVTTAAAGFWELAPGCMESSNFYIYCQRNRESQSTGQVFRL
ncbi:hypothetical protein O5345_06085 [Escherichia coli]|nr:hypothetical protein [Escherichia coli]